MSDSPMRSRLREAIERLRVTDTAFAEAGGVSRQTLAGYINIGREPTRETLSRWVQSYGLSAHWLLTGEGDMLQAPPSAALASPLAQRVDRVATTMSSCGADDLSILRATRAMIDGEIGKILERGGYGVAEPPAGLSRAADQPADYASPKKAAGDGSD